MIAGAALLGFALLLLLLRLWVRLTPAQSWAEFYGGWESVLAILGLCAAATWFLIARPDAAKVKVEQQVTAYPVGQSSALILAEITIQNVGGTELHLRGQPYSYFVQQITPLPPSVRKEMNKRHHEDGTLVVFDGDRWGSMASLTSKMNSNIRAGESEHLYLRVIVPCMPGLRVYSSFWLERPSDLADRVSRLWSLTDGKNAEVITWVRQVPVDLTSTCAGRK